MPNVFHRLADRFQPKAMCAPAACEHPTLLRMLIPSSVREVVLLAAIWIGFAALAAWQGLNHATLEATKGAATMWVLCRTLAWALTAHEEGAATKSEPEGWR